MTRSYSGKHLRGGSGKSSGPGSHQGQHGGRRATAGYEKSRQSGRTLHQRSTGSDDHAQSRAASVHQGQHGRSGGTAAAGPMGYAARGRRARHGAGSISGTGKHGGMKSHSGTFPRRTQHDY